MKLIDQAKSEHANALADIKKYRAEIKNLPKGRLECHKRGNGWRWYVNKNGKREYIVKKHHKTAEALAYKRVAKTKLDQLETRVQAIDAFIESMKVSEDVQDKRNKPNAEVDRLAQAYYDRNHPEETERKREMDSLLSEDVQKFKGRDINIKEYPIRSEWGLRFRSKTEAMIYRKLRENGLLVLYEPDMELGEWRISPDFIVYSKRTGKKWVWEHFGQMDREDYVNKNKNKIMHYIENGYIPNINMIATYEIKENAIDMLYIESLINIFLL